MKEKIQVIVVVDEKSTSEEKDDLNNLAKDLHLTTAEQMPADGFCLFLQDHILSLTNLGEKEKNIISVDFSSGASTYRREQGGGKNQALGKAIGLNKKALNNNSDSYVLDATAGLGKDAFVLASLGCVVKMVEQSPIVGALLRDALNRGEEDFEIEDLIANMSLVIANSVDYMRSETLLKNPPDVVYLDPMYPERKKSAKVKKEMQTLQQLLGHQDDLESLLDAALACAKKRVVVKRPKGATPLSATSSSTSRSTRGPTHTIESKKTRYDVYMNS